VLLLSKIINDIGKKLINELLNDHVAIEPKRTGLTFGYDTGECFGYQLKNDRIKSQLEFSGRPINFASRLQSKLEKNEDTGKILFSLAARNTANNKTMIKEINNNVRKLCFKNIFNDKETKCFSFDLNDNNIFRYVNKNKTKTIGRRVTKDETLDAMETEDQNIVNDVFKDLNYDYYLL
jgi:hypothetical protein